MGDLGYHSIKGKGIIPAIGINLGDYFLNPNNIDDEITKFIEEDYMNIAKDTRAINIVSADLDYSDLIYNDETKMDDITNDETAMDKVTDSEVAMDKVTDKEMLMDKVTDSEIAMDKVTDKEMPMNKVTDKEMNMEKVMADVMPRTKMLLSQWILDIMWSKEMASEKFWKAGEPEPPRTFTVAGDNAEITLPVEGGRTVLHFDCSDNEGEDYEETAYWEIDIDLTDINNLELKTKADELDGAYSELIIWLNGEEIFSTGERHLWIERSFDVSSNDGINTLGLGGNITGVFGPDIHSWADISLEE